MSRTIITSRRKWDGKIDLYAGYEYVIAYMISELRLIPFSEWETVERKLDECMEARIFGRNGELHLFREDDEMMAVTVRDLPDEIETSEIEADTVVGDDPCADEYSERQTADIRIFATIDRLHEIRDNCKNELPEGSKVSKIIIREYISYDGDGQAYTSLTRLVGLL